MDVSLRPNRPIAHSLKALYRDMLGPHPAKIDTYWEDQYGLCVGLTIKLPSVSVSTMYGLTKQ